MTLKIRIELQEIGLRLCAVLAGSFFVYRGWIQWRLTPGHPTLPLFVLGELTVVTLLLFARTPRHRDWRPLSCASTVVATYYFLAVSLIPATSIIPEYAGVLLQCLGLLWSIYAKMSLRRSFGLLPANRGVVTRGAYRLVRHPIYAGYFLCHMGFLLTNCCWQNLFVFVVLYLVQAWRMLREEDLLSADPAYRAYVERVRFRVMPGVF